MAGIAGTSVARIPTSIATHFQVQQPTIVHAEPVSQLYSVQIHVAHPPAMLVSSASLSFRNASLLMTRRFVLGSAVFSAFFMVCSLPL